MSLKGLDGRYLLVNQSYANWVQALPEQILGQRADAFFSAEDAEKIRQQDAEVLRTLEARQFEECITLGGERRVTLVSKFPLFDADGRPAGVGSVDADISAIRQEKQAKREAEQRYRALVEQSLMGIYILQDERIVYANPKLASLLGYPQQDLQDISLETLLGGSEYQRMRHQIAHRFREQINIMHFATRARRQDGAMVDVEVHSRLFDYQGRPAIIGVVMDISERVSADANLRLAAKVFENSAEGILILDADTRIVAVNDAFHRITGYDEAHARGASRASSCSTMWPSTAICAMPWPCMATGRAK
ncbi:PAS domain S-box protein [Paludibacterium denitrificans]|uniref:PAS domain S-box protein n=1 Tax=Paludibacterium denitrificans TaxID=2675226 RepID=UPI001E448C85|nr:PAS domain S-box protein [Paludibacterium denitrificans]